MRSGPYFIVRALVRFIVMSVIVFGIFFAVPSLIG